MHRTRSVRSRKSRIHRACGIIVAIVVAFAAHQSPCAAQGTSGTLPDPISTHELRGYADRLKLSDQQRQAVNMIHDEYKREFRALRQGEIAEFLKEMRSMQGSMMMPRRDAVEATLKKMEQLTNRIASLDNRMFDQLQAILTEEQLAMMPRVRMARQRVRYAASQMMAVTGSPGASTIDLSQMVNDLDLPAEVEQTIDPTLSQYESRLTAGLGKLSESASTMMMRMFDAMEEMGFAEQSMSDPETAVKLGEAMQKIWRDVTMDVVEKANDITELNQRTYKSLVPMLPDSQRRPLRSRYYSRAYPEAGFALKDESAFFTAALKPPDLTEDQRAVITQAQTTLTDKMDRLADEAISMIDAHRANFSPFDFNSEQVQEYYKKLGELQASAAEAQRAATETVNTALGPELARTVGREVMENAQTSTATVLGAAIPAPAAVEVDESGDVVVQQAWSGDQYVPGPITAADLTDYSQRLELNEEQTVVLKQMLADYMVQYKVIQDGQIAALSSAVAAMWRFDENASQPAGPAPESIDTVYRLRREAIAAVRQLDQSFFDDVQASVLEDTDAPRLTRVRMQRERAGYARGQDVMWGWFGGSNEPKIDLTEFLRQQRLSEADQAALDGEMIRYEEAATAAFRRRFDAGLDMQRAQELWQAEAMKARSDSESNPMAFAARYQEVMGEVTRRVRDQNDAITKLNRDAMERMLTALPTETAAKVRSAYNRRAFPNVFNDELSLDQRLTAAMNLPDLGPEQRRRLNELAVEYRPAYARFCDQMVEIVSTSGAPSWAMDGDPEGWQKWQERQEALAGVRFDRQELSLRTIGTMKSILSEAQISAIGGMPEPRERGPYDDWVQ